METSNRLEEVVSRLAADLITTVQDLGISEEELGRGLRFLTEVGQRDEFGLLSDILGVSVTVDRLTHGDGHRTTSSNVEGPFYRPGAPMLSKPYSLASEDEPGDALIVSGKVTDGATGEPVAGAVLDAWQANAAGAYSNEDASLGEWHLRGRMEVDPDGTYRFRTVVPPPYEIPKEGPVGALLRSLGRHAFRPAHLHLKATAPGFAPLTTMVFFQGDPYLGSDAIGAVKDSLVVPLDRRDDPAEAADWDVSAPFWTCRFDVALRREQGGK